jgi:hypothetical protein
MIKRLAIDEKIIEINKLSGSSRGQLTESFKKAWNKGNKMQIDKIIWIQDGEGNDFHFNATMRQK